MIAKARGLCIKTLEGPLILNWGSPDQKLRPKMLNALLHKAASIVSQASEICVVNGALLFCERHTCVFVISTLDYTAHANLCARSPN